MKKSVIVISILVLMLTLGTAVAGTKSYEDEIAQTFWVDTSGNSPVFWVQLYFPDSTTRGTYSAGVFEYDSYVARVSALKVTLYGHGDNSSSPIDMFLSFDNKATYKKIGSYNVANNTSFTLALDILHNDLLYNGVDVGNLTNVSLNSFMGADTFWVGYGCHFYHDKTSVNVTVDRVPEPATLLLIGLGLAGLGVIRKKI